MDAVTWIATILKIVFVVIIILTFAPVLIWAERRQSAMIQDRIGPTRAGVKLFGKNIRLLGLLHPLADALKFVWKEDFVPPKADKLLHSLAPIIALVPAISVFAVIPFGGYLYLDHLFDVLAPGSTFSGESVSLQVANINVGILYVFAIAGTGVVGAAIARRRARGRPDGELRSHLGPRAGRLLHGLRHAADPRHDRLPA